MEIGIDIDSNNKVTAIYNDMASGQIRLTVDNNLDVTKFWKYENGSLIEDTDKMGQVAVENEILNKKQFLAGTDYVMIKISEYEYLGKTSEIPVDYADILTQRQQARDRINELGG